MMQQNLPTTLKLDVDGQSRNLHPDLVRQLARIAQERQTDILTVVLQAIATEIYLWQKLQDSNTKLLLEDDRTITELRFRDERSQHY
ncbi:hypothetical protein [Nostoc sp. FACHB-133]|uniref:hypothetical protein n=1 Tax=Nostoc sp. FACHB-133 TaxID=2692835 RepID=UPI0016830033|nr:hypothetical protein [Nostoc sp. FACHB-133]MBD2525806.1 hypothetical protein [Nostoc sp. FACHB-133]